MAVEVLCLAMASNEVRALHPFFGSANGHVDPDPSEPHSIRTSAAEIEENQYDDQMPDGRAIDVQIEDINTGKKRRGRVSKKTTDAQRGFMAAFTAKNQDESSVVSQVPMVCDSGIETAALDIDPNYDRRKRRCQQTAMVRTQVDAEADPHEHQTQNRHTLSEPIHASLQPSVAQHHPNPLDEMDIAEHKIDSGSLLEVEADPKLVAKHPATPSPPVKMLRLNSKGKFSSPSTEINEANAPRISNSKDVPRKTKQSRKRARELVVTIRYGSTDPIRQRIGAAIDVILSRVTPVNRAAVEKTTQIVPMQKETHPFFLSKAVHVTKSARPSEPQKRATATPGKLRAQAAEANRERDEACEANFSAWQRRSGTQLRHALWPSQNISHIRALPSPEIDTHLQTVVRDRHLIQGKKQKNSVAALSIDEALLGIFGTKLLQDVARHVEPLRRPRRLLTTGEEVQGLVQSLVPSPVQRDTEPCQSLLRKVGHQLTPFDLFQCETQDWARKYAPQDCQQVLERGKEMQALREWLQALVVHSTGFASSRPEDFKKKHKRRKRREDELDDFIVSDDDVGSFDILKDAEDGSESDITRRDHKSSLVRGHASKDGKLANVVLISGPSGCGKTAAVYALAKELNFQVFEINAGARRSGKEIMDKVGDMAENHLVQQEVARQLDLDAGSSIAVQHDNQKDIDSGRQSTMATFFSSKPHPKGPQRATKFTNPEKSVMNAHFEKKRSQKQSLILFEDVDILFDEDQGFWATVKALAMHSRRPIILTCCDERMVRLEEKYFHAILRFSQPSLSTATDYMLLLAAVEGHLLQRSAIEALYRSKGYDLRASITELDFWCQMAVGDTKGGLEWLFQRWPPGSDLDEHGRKLRVVSQNTYVKGLGLLPYNLIVDADPHTVDEGYEHAWTDLNLAPRGFRMSQPLHSEFVEQTSKFELSRLEASLDALSAADVFCPGMFASSYERHFHLILDTTLPAISEKAMHSYTEDCKVLQADPVQDYSQTQLGLSNYISTAVRQPTSSSNPHSFEEQLMAESLLQAIEADRRAWQKEDVTTPLEPLTNTSTSSFSTSSGPLLTCIDRPAKVIATDVSPFIRSIVAYDMRLEAQRSILSSVLSGSSRTTGKLRKTRAARSALEGGKRETTRRENWFIGPAALDFEAVMRTGGESWAGIGSREDSHWENDSSSVRSVTPSTGIVEDLD